MQSKWLGRIGLSALVMGVVASSGGMVGCAAERDPINRVQLNAIPKSFLVGEKFDDPSDDPEFYSRSMVINVPYGESGAEWGLFTNSINTMAKIKWQIQESMLVGRVSFERLDGTDGQGLAKTANPERDPSKPIAQNDGIVIYQFPIVSQFDIRRDYNPTTGEEANVVVENSTDRPWNEREYVRVDFSRNMVTTAYDFDTLSLLGMYGGVNYSPTQFDIRNPNDADAPVFDLDRGYFDVTNKLFAEPQMIRLPEEWGGDSFPGCFLPNLIAGGTSPVGNCNPNEVTIRHSFKRVTNSDYEPLNWDGFKFETYGAFTTERNGYNRDYGMRDNMWKRYISRYNIWERHHHYTDPANMTGETKCRADADCSGILVEGVSGASHCDLHNQKCTEPYQLRKAKPIVWHYADGSAADYYVETREAGEEWDAAMRGAVASAKYAECKRFGGSDCPEVITGNFAQEEDAMYLVKEVNACRRGEVLAEYKPFADPNHARPEYAKIGVGEGPCESHAQALGEARGYSQAVIDLAKQAPMVILCHSPVLRTDLDVCGKEGTVARLGDLRFHLVTNIAQPQTGSPWGIMTDSNDPLTGEHISASINMWTHVNDLFSRGVIDTLRYIGGELKDEDVTDARYIDQWAAAAKGGNGMFTPIMDDKEIDKRVASAAGTTVEKLRATSATMADPRALGGKEAKLRNALVANLKRVEQTKAAFDAPSANAPVYQARAAMAKGSLLEAEVATPAMQQLASAGFGKIALDSSTKVAATSIFRGLNPALRRGLEHKRELAYAARGACVMNFEATAPLAYIALSDIVQEKFGKFNPSDAPNVQNERADRMKDWLKRRAGYAVIAHEMGHSFALRHNFVSSSDAWNFRPQYWQLRTNDKKVTQTCKADGTSDGKTCVGPRWLDPVTANESKNMITLWTQSSTMEYPGEIAQDLLGLGAYDFGAARMFYGEVATVYTDSRFNNRNAATPAVIAQGHQNQFGGLLGFRYGDFSNPTHYSQLDNTANLIEKCDRVSDINAFKPGNWDEAKDGAWSHIVDGHIVSNEEGQFTRCSQPKVDFVQWDALKDAEDKTHAADANGRVRVPHGFASDEWADLGNIAVFRHDNGADLYEVMHFWIAQQEMTHIFTNYRRGRRDFNLFGTFQRTLSRYHEKMRDSAKAIGLYTTLARDTVAEYGSSGNDPEAFVAAVLKQVAVDNTVASSIAFDHFAHVFSRPQPGAHGTGSAGDTVLRWQDDNGSTGGFASGGRPVLSVANGVQGGFGVISLAGRPIENALARNQGRDYDRDFTQNVGSYYEKAFTAMLLTESADNFISSSRDDFTDPRFRSVSIADVFPDGYRRWIANNLTGDDSIKGVFTRGTGGGPGPSPAELDTKGYALIGQTSWWPTSGAETCFPQGERLTCRDPFSATPGPGGGVGPVIDPQIGWEQQKFALIQSLMYLPDNARTKWLDMFQVWELGWNADPGFENRIEFHNPDGKIYIAKTFGTETLFGKTVQKGVAARVLEYANELLQAGVVTTPIVKNGVTIGYLPTLDAQGKVQYRSNGQAVASCENSKECTRMKNYVSVPRLMREAMLKFGWTRNADELKGVYGR
ncbi:MAG: hypothetical protein KF819_24205 [Labilithrix sp.]|nr:hypothetical protein [Labilithrix sp.]